LKQSLEFMISIMIFAIQSILLKYRI